MKRNTRLPRRALSLLVLALVAFAPTASVDAGPRRFAADRPIDVTHLKLMCRVDLAKKRVTAFVTLDATAQRRISAVRLDAVDLDVRSATVKALDGKTLSTAFHEEEAALVLDLAEPLDAGAKFTVSVRYSVTDPEAGLYFRAPTEAEPDVPYQVWTQGETHEARHWIPCIDQPNERHTSEMIVTVAKGLRVLSNGRLVEKTSSNESDEQTFHWRQETGHTPYLMTMVVGQFHVVEDEWRGKPVTYWVPPDRADDVERSFGNTKRMLDFFSNKIGVEYPWHGYAQIVVEQFTHGGMENTGATTLTERTLHDARAHLDFSSDGLVAHELAHQWYGDLLTCSDWAHTWLNEGFASYFEALWEEHDKGADAFAYNMLGKANSARRGGTKLPIVHLTYDGPWQQFDARAYPKGAWVLHMLRRQLGDELWWKCVHRYTSDFAYRDVETVDLQRSFEKTSGRSLGRFFHDWTTRPGHPVASATIKWHDKDGLLEIDLLQTQADEAFHFPLAVDIVVPEEPEPRRVTRDVTEKRERIFVPLPKRPSAVRIDPGSTILWELKEKMDRPLREAQLRSDPDPIGRIRAAQSLGGSRHDRDRALLVDAFGKEPFWGVRIEIANALGKTGGAVARDGLLAALGEEHPRARRAVVEALGKFRDEPTVETALRKIVADGDASSQVEASAISAWAGLRPEGAIALLESTLDRESHRDRIRENALRGLALQQDPAALDTLREWSQRSRPRTARVAALRAMADLVRSGKLSDAQINQIVATLTEALHKDESVSLKRNAADALRDVGGQAHPALAALEALRDHDPNNRVREQSKTAIEKITSGAPARLELGRLREMIDGLRKENESLKDRLDRVEAR